MRSVVGKLLCVLCVAIGDASDVPSGPHVSARAAVHGDSAAPPTRALVPPLKINPEVAEALSSGRAVVALESTIISHGMPYPQNVETARAVETIVRQGGAVPATIAILDGVCCIGLDDAELDRFAKLGSTGEVRKISRRDLAAIVARDGHGGTTVSCTMLLAHMAGIGVFVTGGIGGVHRGGQESMDVSADLCELGRTPVMVVCAGVKSILDIPRTLEYLETQGVAVLSLGTDEFPASSHASHATLILVHTPPSPSCRQ